MAKYHKKSTSTKTKVKKGKKINNFIKMTVKAKKTGKKSFKYNGKIFTRKMKKHLVYYSNP
tara:strand:+ start:10405 stop:10587 length:183 start_codon:yes stop_codon:yes gene_type:complete